MHLIIGILGIIMILSFSINKEDNIIIRNSSKYSYDIYLFSCFYQNYIGYLLLKILNVNYYIVILMACLSGFIVILVKKHAIRKNKILTRILLGN